MARLGLDFVTPSRATARAVLLVLACAGVAHALLQRTDLLAAIAEEEAVADRLERKLSARSAVQSLPSLTPQAAEEARNVVLALRAPWEAMLDDLQRAASDAILLTQVQPGADGKVLVSGRADSSAVFTAYIVRLRKLPGWKDVAPVSETLGMADISGKPLQFQLVAEYRHD